VMNDISRWISENEKAKLDPRSAEKKKRALIKKHAKLAGQAYKKEDYEHSRTLYEKLLMLDPGNREARKGLEQISRKEQERTLDRYVGAVKELHKQGRYTEARATIDRGLGLDPDNKALKKLAKENGRRLQAASAAAAKGEPAPRSVESAKKKSGLVALFTREKQPSTGNEAEVKQLLDEARHEYKKGNYTEAVSLYEDVLALDHGNKKASKEIDRAREKSILKSRDRRQAEEQRTEQEVRDKVQFYTNVAQKLHRQGKYESAKVVIQKGLLLDPDDRTLRQLKDDNEIFMKQVIEQQAATSEEQKFKQKKDALINKGIKQYLLGDYEQAIKYFNEVLVLDPADEKAKNSIAKIEQKLQGITPAGD